MIILYHKPFQMLSQYNVNPDYPEQEPLPAELEEMGVYPVGRLDYDSEGLLLLSDDRGLERTLLDPENKLEKVYAVEVEGEPSEEKLDLLRAGGLTIRAKKKFHRCARAGARLLPGRPRWVKDRVPPVCSNVETSWIELTLTEGKNRQVRRMTAAIGHPTLRLIRTRVGKYQLPEGGGKLDIIME